MQGFVISLQHYNEKDLILLSFCKAEKQNDETMEINNTEDFLEDLRLNWGRYLKRYVKDYKE